MFHAALRKDLADKNLDLQSIFPTHFLNAFTAQHLTLALALGGIYPVAILNEGHGWNFNVVCTLGGVVH